VLPTRRLCRTRERHDVETTYQEVVSHFAARSTRAEARLTAWRGDHHKREVVPYVERAVTRIPYTATPDVIEDACRETVHALGEVKRRDAESVPEVVNWHPAFAFEHVLHHASETLGHIPTYQEFREFCRADELARHMLLTPAQDRYIR
jgi:hypothetical protein